MGKKSNIPKEWRNNTNKGARVPGTPCVPMKTPFSTASWDLETLVKSCPKVRSRPKRNSQFDTGCLVMNATKVFA